MKNLLLTFALALASLGMNGQKLIMDPLHAKLQFAITHLTISSVTGEFKKFEVTLDHKKPDFSDVKFTVTAETSSINTGIEARDNHLKSADFFDFQKYPSLTFVTTSLVKGKNNNYTLKGNLTLHGITQSVSLNLKYNGTSNPMSKKQTYGFTVTGTFKRSTFGIGPNFPEAIIGDQVNLLSNLEFTSENN